MGPRERRDREREETRTLILDAARELFALEGYEAVTMRRIADRIEYSPTAIYFHFRDKDTLIRELCDEDFGRLAAQFITVAGIADPLERLRQTGLAYASFAIQYPNHYRLMFMTPHPANHLASEHRIERGNPEEDAYAFLRSIVDEAVEKGCFAPAFRDVDLIAQTMWAGVHGVVSLDIAKCNDDWVDWSPLKERIEMIIDAMIIGMRSVERV